MFHPGRGRRGCVGLEFSAPAPREGLPTFFTGVPQVWVTVGPAATHLCTTTIESGQSHSPAPPLQREDFAVDTWHLLLGPPVHREEIGPIYNLVQPGGTSPTGTSPTGPATSCQVLIAMFTRTVGVRTGFFFGAGD